jgi:hypothetical protein
VPSLPLPANQLANVTFPIAVVTLATITLYFILTICVLFLIVSLIDFVRLTTARAVDKPVSHHSRPLHPLTSLLTAVYADILDVTLINLILTP